MSQLSLLVFVHVGLVGFCVGGGAVGGGDGCFYLGGWGWRGDGVVVLCARAGTIILCDVESVSWR